MGKEQENTVTANPSSSADPVDGEPPLVSVIIGTYNERENIGKMIDAVLENVRKPVEIIVVDDDSPDGTWEYVRGLDKPGVKLLHRLRENGLASAIARGVLESRGEIVGWIDADMSGESIYLPKMVDLTAQHDVVIASRFVEGGGDKRHFSRTISSRMVNWVAGMVLGYGIKDYNSCVVMVRREVFNDVMIIPYGFGDFFIEFIYGCCKKGFKVHEMPFFLLSREEGASKSFPSVTGFLWLGSKYLMRIIATRFRPD